MSIKMDAVELPQFVEKKNTDWIFAGKFNDYFNFLLEMYNTANTHNSIINNKIKYVVGQGFQENPIVTGDGNDLNSVLRKITTDYELYNGFAIEVLYNSTFEKVVSMRQVDFSRIRVNADESQFAYADRWVNESGKPIARGTLESEENGWTIYPAFNPQTAQADEGVQLLYYKEYRPSVDYYPLPEYIAAMQYIVAEKKIAEYHVNNIDNNFWNNFIIHFNDGEPKPDEKRALTETFKKRHVGTDAKEKVLFTFTDTGIAVPTVTELGSNASAEVFKYLSEEVQSQLYVGHGVTSPILFGVKTEGQLGGRNEIIEANALYQNRYVDFRQSRVEEQFNSIVQVNDPAIELEIQPLKPIGYDIFSSVDMLAVLSLEEKRAIIASEYGIPLIEGSVVEPPAPTGRFEAEALEEFRALGVDEVEGYEHFLDITDAPADLREEIERIIYKEDFASSGKASPRTKSKQDKNGFAVRYRYQGNAAPERDFCRVMMGDNKLYRKEDIQNMRNRPVNPGFGMDGTNTYDIWLYQGGGLLSQTFPQGTCKHFWKMEVYVASETPDSSRVKLENEVSIAVAIRNGISPLQNNAKVHTSNHSSK